jgi:hypothetical protein
MEDASPMLPYARSSHDLCWSNQQNIVAQLQANSTNAPV